MSLTSTSVTRSTTKRLSAPSTLTLPRSRPTSSVALHCDCICQCHDCSINECIVYCQVLKCVYLCVRGYVTNMCGGARVIMSIFDVEAKRDEHSRHARCESC